MRVETSTPPWRKKGKKFEYINGILKTVNNSETNNN